MSEVINIDRADAKAQLSKLDLKPGDVLIAKLDFDMTGEQISDAERLFMQMANCPVLVLDRRADLSVLTKADIESRTHV